MNIRVFFHFLVFALLLLFPYTSSVLAQFPELEMGIEFDKGEGVFVSELKSTAFVVLGEKIKRTFRSDYYQTTGTLVLDEGIWSITVTGLGGDDQTAYTSTEIEIDALPARCIKSAGNFWSRALGSSWKDEFSFSGSNTFEISCLLRSFEWEIRSGVPISLLLIAKLD